MVFDAIEMVSQPGRGRLREYAAGGNGAAALPGFWSAPEVYGEALGGPGELGETRSVPMDLVVDPLGDMVGHFSVVDLPHRLKVILPSSTQGGRNIPRVQRNGVARQVQEVMSELGGGCTSQSGHGHWVDPFGGVADEDVVVVETYSSDPTPPDALREIVTLVMDQLDQHTVAVVVGDRMCQFTR